MPVSTCTPPRAPASAPASASPWGPACRSRSRWASSAWSRPRSGLALKHGITLVNSPGVIDSGFRGELRIILQNTDQNSEFKVAPGDRIAQLLLIPVATASPLEADSLDSTSRGSGGFGSSGT